MLTTATRNRDDLVSNGKVDPFDADGYTQYFGVERKGEVVFDHREQPGTLLGLRVSVEDSILNQLSQTAFAGRPTRLSGLWAGPGCAGRDLGCCLSRPLKMTAVVKASFDGLALARRDRIASRSH